MKYFTALLASFSFIFVAFGAQWAVNRNELKRNKTPNEWESERERENKKCMHILWSTQNHLFSAVFFNSFLMHSLHCIFSSLLCYGCCRSNRLFFSYYCLIRSTIHFFAHYLGKWVSIHIKWPNSVSQFQAGHFNIKYANHIVIAYKYVQLWIHIQGKAEDSIRITNLHKVLYTQMSAQKDL